jgi:hypothetical protein
MIKKLFTIALIFSFLNFTLLIVAPKLVLPNYAFAEDEESQEEKDAKSARISVPLCSNQSPILYYNHNTISRMLRFFIAIFLQRTYIYFNYL